MAALRPLPPPPAMPPQPLHALLDGLRAAGLLAARSPVEAEALTVSSVTHDSRAVTEGALFVAVRGEKVDGHEYLDAAFAQGAVAALVEQGHPAIEHRIGHVAYPPSPLGKGAHPPGVVLVPATDTRAALGVVANRFFERPSEQLDLLGVTGTNGKTTTAFLLYHLLERLGKRTGLIGTVEVRIGQERYEATHTTPDAVTLAGLLRRMADAGCSSCAMEVSSHALDQERVRGLRFRAGVFTNLTHDHLDYHGTLDQYAAAKKRLFDGLDESAVAVVNADDPAWATMIGGTRALILTYGTAEDADVRVEVLDNALDGLLLRLDGVEKKFRLAGRFNALNLAAAYAVGRELGFSQSETLGALADAPGVPGRFETVRSADGVLGVVDYAHTPDALENVLGTARQMMGDEKRLWAVFGCGGDRDRAKRPVMGRVAERLADRVVLTSDNPRTERPAAILDEIRSGLDRPDAALTVEDRAEAIARAAREAQPGDVVVVAGKGHEDYQIVGGEKRPFDDRDVLREAFARRGGPSSVGSVPQPAEVAA